MLRRLLFVSLGLILPLIVINVLLFNALPKSKRLVEPLVVEYGIDAPAFARTMDLWMQQPALAGNRLDLLGDGEAIYAAKLDAIAAAEHSVTFETYEFWGEEAAGAFADAFSQAAARGVSVHLLLDYIGSRQADPDKFRRMEAAGVELIRFRSPSWYQLSRFNHRTHRKLLVVDGREGFIGGANAANAWLPEAVDSAYRDNHFHVRGPVVGQMQAAFMETWLDASGRALAGDAYFPQLDEVAEVRAQVVNSSPREGRHRIRLMLLYALAAAREEVTLATAYFYPDQAFLDALTAAAARGVRVRILVPGDSIDQGYLRHASVNRWRPMLEASVELHEYQPAMHHSKLATVDDRWASIGSANLDNRSFRINDEANLSVFDADFARQIRELIESDLEEAERYTLERWQERSLFRRAFGWLGNLIGPHL